MRWHHTYLKIGGNTCSWSNHHRIGFHHMIIEGCLHQKTIIAILSRIIEPIVSKLSLSPLMLVKEGRSSHSSVYSIQLRIVNVFLELKGSSRIIFRSSYQSPARASWPISIDCSNGKSALLIHSFKYSQIQRIEHYRMIHQQVWLIAVEDNLYLLARQLIKPVSDNDGTQ